jgi:transposase
MKRQQFETVAGIDVHRDVVVVTLRKHRRGANDETETRRFETFRDSLRSMALWLIEEGAEVAGLESTGVYWHPVVRAMQETAPKVIVQVLNPLEVKSRAGRKTDRKDSIRISELVMYGCVTPSFVPSWEQNELRKLTRHRSKATADGVRYKNRIIKELECSGVKLASVVSDCLGKSGRAMIEALLAGGKTSEQIAQLARGKLREKIPLLIRAVDGAFTPSTASVLRQLLASYDAVKAQLAALDSEISELMKTRESDSQLVCTIPGVDEVAAAAALAESGVDMSLFPSARHLAAWTGLSPGSEESAGKSKKAPTRKGNKFIRTVLVQCAWSAVRTKDCVWRTTFKRLVSRLGPRKAIVAIARRMLLAYYHILRDRRPYAPPSELPLPEPIRQKIVRSLSSRLKSLGFDVSLKPAAQAVS